MATAGSLFSGIGGLDLAFALAGFDIRYQVEINPFCQKVLKKHAKTYWKNARHYADVTECGVGRAHELERVDVLFGGFPCQDISQAGKRAGIREGKKSGLWREMRRIIGEVRPKIIFLENVDAIIHRGRGGTDVIADLTDLGYVGRFGIISAADAGAPHLRKRWWCVGYSDRFRQSKPEGIQFDCGDEERDDTPRERGGRNSFRPPVSAGQMGNAAVQRFAQDDEFGQRRDAAWFADRPDDTAVGDASSIVPQGQRQIRQQIASVGHQSPQPERPGHRIARRRDLSKSRLGRYVDGLSGELDNPMQHQFPAPPGSQFEGEPARTTRYRAEEELTAYGNAVVPQVVYPIAVELFAVVAAANARSEADTL